MRAGREQWMTRQEQVAVDDGKQQDLMMAGDERRSKVGKRRHIQSVNAYSNKF
jgi:hypothetical protein